MPQSHTSLTDSLLSLSLPGAFHLAPPLLPSMETRQERAREGEKVGEEGTKKACGDMLRRGSTREVLTVTLPFSLPPSFSVAPSDCLFALLHCLSLSLSPLFSLSIDRSLALGPSLADGKLLFTASRGHRGSNWVVLSPTRPCYTPITCLFRPGATKSCADA
jgi:hypothetical protein